MNQTKGRELGRYRRHRRIRKKVIGLLERPRLCVFRSHKHLYAQLVDDVAGKTIIGWSTLDDRLKAKACGGNSVEAANGLGMLVAEDTKKRGINGVVFDRGGYLYHGRVKALAEGVRAGGISV